MRAGLCYTGGRGVAMVLFWGLPRNAGILKWSWNGINNDSYRQGVTVCPIKSTINAPSPKTETYANT